MGGLSYSRAATWCQPVDKESLLPLFAPLTSLHGVGETLAGLMAGNPAFNHACWACRAVYINLS